MAFHNVIFPAGIARGAVGGPKWNVEIVTTGTGLEKRNTPWAHGRRTYRIQVPPRGHAENAALLDFFLARRGQLYSFRFQDLSDYTSAAANGTPTALDQHIGSGSASPAETDYQLRKAYGVTGPETYFRDITKPRLGTVLVAIDGVTQTETTDYTIDYTTGIITFTSAPTAGEVITAGFQFDVPVRFSEDVLESSMVETDISEYQSVELIEVNE